MKKQALYFIALLIFVGQLHFDVQAAKYSSSGAVATAIKKYKSGNYTGCMQDMQSIVAKDPSNSVAYYYMAISYVQAGKRSEAVDAYNKVLSLNPNPTIYKYAITGKTCLEFPEKCGLSPSEIDLDKAVNSPFNDGLSTKVKNEIEKQKLNGIKQEINKGKDINNYDLRNFTDYSKIRSDAATDDKVASESGAKPTNDEIVAALKVLNNAGLNPYAQASVVNPYAANQQSPEMAQMSALLGNNQAGNNNNAMMNMLPYMLTQNKPGEANYSPQLVQSMMMNSMLPNFDFNTKDNN